MCTLPLHLDYVMPPPSPPPHNSYGYTLPGSGRVPLNFPASCPSTRPVSLTVTHTRTLSLHPRTCLLPLPHPLSPRFTTFFLPESQSLCSLSYLFCNSFSTYIEWTPVSAGVTLQRSCRFWVSPALSMIWGP
ncbi:hypothetical protein BOTBODRAFT_348492 [Botryobasidium botryosum FD-172 SS1]|uniref:Uncharacterized protein n=1 Tax=Botryobasidium botryosum (strain FD-172 SS1) TaxID=930990 RepID=A0A067MFL2_BOTB1|nr:hypothetical protein BOTBODRAFT_348492 [Botryobasidium botryosum FD-172 SS1]